MASIMPIEPILHQLFPGRVIAPRQLQDIPQDVPLVYVFGWEDSPIVLGKGTFARARVIFDDTSQITRPHLKSLFVRLCHLYGRPGARCERFVIPFSSDEDARKAERGLHREIGGNRRNVDPAIMHALLRGLTPDTIPYLLIQQAIHSSFDGQDDLYRWWRKGLIHEHDWAVVKQRLGLP
jgi:hypothetical protein